MPGSSTSSAVVDWLDQFGTPENDIAWKIIVDYSGIYVGGGTSSSLDGVNHFGAQDAFVRKYDFRGNQLWTTQLGSAQNDAIVDLAYFNNAIYAVGNTEGTLPGNMNRGSTDIFLVKLTANGGQTLWMYQFGSSSYDQATCLEVNNYGLWVGGYSSGPWPHQTYQGGTDCWVSRYLSSGAPIWLRQYGTMLNDYIFDIGLIGLDAYVCGKTDGAFHGYVQMGGGDVFLSRWSMGGINMDTHQFGTSSSDSLETLSIDIQQRIFITGYTQGAFPGFTNQGSADVFVQGYDPYLNLWWTDQFGGPGWDATYAVHSDLSGLYVGGETADATGMVWDAFIRKYDQGGTTEWTHQFSSDDGWDWISGLDGLGNGGVYFCGETEGTMPGKTSNGDIDAFAGKLIDPGDISVSPMEVDLEEVEVWDTVTTTITMRNLGMAWLWVDGISLADDGDGAFAISWLPSFPFNLRPTAVIPIVVEYHPWEEGEHSATLVIDSDDKDEPTVEVIITGSAVTSEAPPDEEVEDTVDYIEDAIEEGSLEGDGAGNSADNKLEAFLDKFDEAMAFYEDGDIENAIGTLNAILKKCDGKPKPPDTITGEAAEELAARILWLIEELEKEL